jgi:hypothetical protein
VGGGDGCGYALYSNAPNTTFQNNEVFGGKCGGLQIYSDEYAVDNAVVRNNYFHDIVRAPHIKDIQESGLAERQFLTRDEVRAKSWGDMDEVKEMFELLEKDGEHLLPVIEWWTFDDELYEEGHPEHKKLDKYHKVCKVYLDRSNNVPENSKEAAEWDPFVELDCFVTPEKKRRTSSKLRKELGEYEEMFPYEQADFFDAPGRWLSFGCGELLSGLQEHYNEQKYHANQEYLSFCRGYFFHCSVLVIQIRVLRNQMTTNVQVRQKNQPVRMETFLRTRQVFYEAYSKYVVSCME